MTTHNEYPERPSGVTLVAIYYFVSAGLALLGMMIGALVGLGIMVAAGTDGDGGGVIVGLLILGAALTIAGLLAVASFVVGWGLLSMRNWARWVAIVLAILALPNFPTGTVIGGLIIWYLLRDDVRVLFEGR